MEQTNVQITQAQPTLTVEIVQNLIPVMTAQVIVGGGSGPTLVFGDTLTGTGTPADPVNVSNDILDQINNNTQTSQDNASQIQDIQDLIPATANQNNPLADQGFVNSSIQTATAYFRGDWATWADVPSDPELYPVDATGNHTPTTNDYMVVIADEQTNGGTWRYKYTGLWSEQGKSGWQAEYQVNETPLTAAQLAALNSGVTAQAVSDISANKAAVANLQTSKQNKLTAGENITIDEDGVISASGGGASLPDQTGNAGAFLQTDGAAVKWSKDIKFESYGVSIGGDAKQFSQGVSIGYGAGAGTNFAIGGVCIGTNSFASSLGVAIGVYAKAAANNAIQLGSGPNTVTGYTNSDANTFKVGNANGNFEMMSADGTIPAERMSATTGTTGQVLTKTDTGMAWTTVSGGGGSGGGVSLPDQTGNAGKFLTTDGATASWGDAIANTAKYPEYQIAIGGTTTSGATGNIVIGHGSSSSEAFSIAIGRNCKVSALGSILLNARGNSADYINKYAEVTEPGCFFVGLKADAVGGMYKMLGADGLIPVERLKLVTDQIGDISTALTAILGE